MRVPEPADSGTRPAGGSTTTSPPAASIATRGHGMRRDPLASDAYALAMSPAETGPGTESEVADAWPQQGLSSLNPACHEGCCTWRSRPGALAR
jgi:hypothetical protein